MVAAVAAAVAAAIPMPTLMLMAVMAVLVVEAVVPGPLVAVAAMAVLVVPVVVVVVPLRSLPMVELSSTMASSKRWEVMALPVSLDCEVKMVPMAPMATTARAELEAPMAHLVVVPPAVTEPRGHQVYRRYLAEVTLRVSQAVAVLAAMAVTVISETILIAMPV